MGEQLFGSGRVSIRALVRARLFTSPTLVNVIGVSIRALVRARRGWLRKLSPNAQFQSARS